MNYEDMNRERLIELLQERDFQISEMSGTTVDHLWGFRVRPSGWTILTMLTAAAPRTVSRAAIVIATCQDHANPPEEKTVDVQMCHVRRSIDALGLSIVTERGAGYSMSRTDAEKFKRWRANCASGLPPCPDFPLHKKQSDSSFTTIGEAAARVLKRVVND